MNYLTGIATVAAIMVFYKLFLERKGRSGEESVNDVSQQSNSTAASSSISHVSEEESINNLSQHSNSTEASSSGHVSEEESIDDVPQQSNYTNSTPSTEPLPVEEYEVFLNYRGSDTRSSITDILYRFLVRSKIRTFRDDDESRKGEAIWPNLVKAIHQSQIFILIFSSDYAKSKWCLRELAEIIEHHKREKGRIILPIFYKVNPRDVRYQTGPYKMAFDGHRHSIDDKTLMSWRAAMNKVGSLKGWHIKSISEAAYVADVVYGVVWSYLNKNNNMKQVIDMLDLHVEGVNLVGIHGIGGIGKTTVAKAVYNKVSANFDRYIFVEDIRETQKQTDSVLILQKKLISNILRMESVGSIAGVSAAKKIIQERVTQFKILVVLDDVDENFNFNEVLGDPNNFAPGSRFIITSRKIEVLMMLSKSQTQLYEVLRMNHGFSLELFCKHAFKNYFPAPGFETLAKDIVAITGGVPSSLKVIGSLLYLEEKHVWKVKLEELLETPTRNVDWLMISYEKLTSEEQHIFLDIACFYIETDKEIASYMWSDCNFQPDRCIFVLNRRSIIKIGDRNEFQMNDQFRDMGREIVHRESEKHPWLRSRIWSNEEALDLLRNNQGTIQVEAIKVNSPSSAVLELGSESFTNLSKLRYFHATGREMIVDFNHVLPNLKWLELQASRINNFNMKNLIIFAIHGLEHDSGIKEASKLKVLNLHGCSELSKLPEFPESGSVEMLHIDHFENRQENLEIGKLHNLKSLKLQRCKLGKIQGGTIGMMKSLKELHVSIDFECDFSSFKQAIADIGVLSSLQVLNVNSPHLVDVLKRIKLPKSLKFLHTASSFDNLEELLDLEELDVNGTQMSLVIPHTIMRGQLKSMRLHSMEGIFMAESDGSTMLLPSSLTRLHIRCLKSEQSPNLNDLGNLTELVLWDCPNLQEIHGLGGLKSLQLLVIVAAGKLTRIDGLGDLTSSTECRLKQLQISDCPLLPTLLTYEQRENDSVQIESLLALQIKGSPLLDGKSIPKLSKFPRLKELEIGEISLNIDRDESAIQLLEGLENLKYLVELKVHNLPKVQRLPSLSKLSKLECLALEDLSGLRQIDGLGELKLLRSIEVQRCFSLERFPVAVDLPYYYGMSRITLDLRGCTNFANVNSDLAPLANLDMHNLTIQWPDEPLEWWINP